MVMSRNASMTTTLELLRLMVPPALPRTAFSERTYVEDRELHSRVVASDMGMADPTRFTGIVRCRNKAGPTCRPRAAAHLAHLLQLCAPPFAEQIARFGCRGIPSQPTSCAWAMRNWRPVGNGVLVGTAGWSISRAVPGPDHLRVRGCWWRISRSRLRLAASSGGGANLLEQLLDHGADAHHLGGLLDRRSATTVGVVLLHRYQPRVDAADDPTSSSSLPVLNPITILLRTSRSVLLRQPRHS